MSIDKWAALVFTQDDVLLNEFLFLLFVLRLRPEAISWGLTGILTAMSSCSEAICPLVEALALTIAAIDIVVASLEVVTSPELVEWHISVSWGRCCI